MPLSPCPLETLTLFQAGARGAQRLSVTLTSAYCLGFFLRGAHRARELGPHGLQAKRTLGLLLKLLLLPVSLSAVPEPLKWRQRLSGRSSRGRHSLPPGSLLSFCPSCSAHHRALLTRLCVLLERQREGATWAPRWPGTHGRFRLFSGAHQAQLRTDHRHVMRPCSPARHPPRHHHVRPTLAPTPRARSTHTTPHTPHTHHTHIYTQTATHSRQLKCKIVFCP